MNRLLTLIAVGVILVGCDRDEPLGPSQPLFDEDRSGSPSLNVVTYNVYVGARVEELLTVNPAEIPGKALELWGDVLATDFDERAEAIADQIETADAHVVGLQEVSLFRFESPSDFVPGQPLPPPDALAVALDYLDILTDVLEARGLHYDVASWSENMDIELPIARLDEYGNFVGLDDIRLTDYDVVLVRNDVPWTNPADGNFAAQLPIDIGGQVILKPSGWASADITFKGLDYRFVNTHLEPADVDPGGEVNPDIAYIQALQLAELLSIVDQSPYPVIMVGDFNSDDDGSTTPTYNDVLAAGFVDAWLIGPPRGTGYTSNQAPDLLNAMSQLFHRIDFVFYRDEFTRETGGFQGAVHAAVVGAEQDDRTPSGLWPSDHAGVAAALTIAPGLGHTE